MTDKELLELAKKCGYWSGETIEMNDIGLKMFADMVALERSKELMQVFTDPENQPSQYGTVTLEYMDECIKEIISGKRKWHLTTTETDRIAFDVVCDEVAKKIREMK